MLFRDLGVAACPRWRCSTPCRIARRPRSVAFGSSSRGSLALVKGLDRLRSRSSSQVMVTLAPEDIASI